MGQEIDVNTLTVVLINKLNRCVVHICNGDYSQARTLFDEVINDHLGLKEITMEKGSDHMLPSYVVSLLAYFYLRVKNLKMAKAVVKSRRFVVDGDHVVQQLKDSQAPAKPVQSSKKAPSNSGGSSTKPVMMNYKSISKNFT